MVPGVVTGAVGLLTKDPAVVTGLGLAGLVGGAALAHWDADCSKQQTGFCERQLEDAKKKCDEQFPKE